jgi:hypothetical protein
MPNDINLRTLFLGLQNNLVAELETSRGSINHPGAKGNATETNWIAMLEKYLPKRYQVSTAFVIDSKGGMSEQQDIVIYDRQYSPFLFNHSGALYIPAESVYAVLEVKQNLTAGHVKYAGEKIKSVRDLHRTNGAITHASGKIDKPRDLFSILGGLLTLESDWSPAFGDAFATSLKSLPGEGRINIGCSLKNGSYSISYNTAGEPTAEIKDGDIVLLSFFLRLLAELQALGTVPAIDIAAYAAWIN